MGDALVANGGRLTGIVPEFFTSENSSVTWTFLLTPQFHTTTTALIHVEMEDYEVVGEEIIVPDMHTRKKMMFDQASSNYVVWP